MMNQLDLSVDRIYHQILWNSPLVMDDDWIVHDDPNPRLTTLKSKQAGRQTKALQQYYKKENYC